MKRTRPVLLLVLLAACSSLHPVVDQTRYFLLSPARAEQSPSTPAPIGLSHIDLPEYLRKREIAWRSGDQEIRYASNLRWAEPLDKMIGRVLASDLGVVLAPNYRPSEVQAEINISFTRFELDQSGLVTVEATWTTRYTSGTARRGAARVSSQGPVLLKDPSGAANELRTALGKLSAEILPTIQITP